MRKDPSHIAPFADYESVFSQPSRAYFSSYTIPELVSQPAHILRLARCVFDHWRERRLERGGSRIMPQLNVSLHWYLSMANEVISY